MTEIKAHPAAALKFIAPFWLVTLLPLLRRAIFGQGTLVLSVVEWLVIALLAVQSILRTRAIRIVLTDSKLIIRKGVFFKSETEIEKRNISCLTCRTDPALFLLSAVFVSIDTEAGRKEVSDFKTLLCRRDAELIRRSLDLHEGRKSFRMGARRITLMTAAISSAAVGVLVAVPMINRIGRVLDVGLTRLLLDTVKEGVFSSAFAFISLLFLFFYAVSFVFLLIKNISMQIGLTRDTIYVGAGVLPRKRTYFKKSAVNNIILEQRPLMRLTRRYLIKVSVAGYSDKKGEGAVVVPAAYGSEVEPFLKNIFAVTRPMGGIKPICGARYRFVRWYILLSAAAPTAIYATGLFFLPAAGVTRPLSLVTLVVLLYLVSLEFYDYGFTRFSDSGDFVFARSVRGFSARELFCRRERIGMFKLRRYRADKRGGSCILTLITRSEGGEKIKVKYINYAAAHEYCLNFWKKQK